MIRAIVEGDTDVTFVRKICTFVGLEVSEPIVDAAGKSGIDKALDKHAATGEYLPCFVLRDLDRDAVCAPSWLEAHAPRKKGRYFCLRLAVPEVEAWFLADARNAAETLRVNEAMIPLDPEGVGDPKATIVKLAGKSTKPEIRKKILPVQGGARSIGRGYESWLIAASDSWTVERAIKRSNSLHRACAALSKLKADWERTLTWR